MKSLKKNLGSISILVLLIGVVTAITIGGLAVTAGTVYTASVRSDAYERALSLAQAGAEYYRWHLAHAPTDFKDGTSNPGPYTHTLSDPYGNTDGSFRLTIDPPASGSSIVTITSEGWLAGSPNTIRKVITRYGKPSLAKYAFLHNANVWFGTKIDIHGKVFSNGGIRMDGTHDSTVQSAKATYTCGSETGCSPATTKNGVWGEGGPQNLWQFPVTSVDFNSVAVDFSAMKTAAQSSGTYLAPSGTYGYHILFSSDGNYTVKKVTSATNKKGWSVEKHCESLNQIISNETAIGTYSISTKPLIFAEDTLWIEGVVNGRATVVAAKFPLDINDMNIWIPNNVTYVAKDSTNSLGIIAQNNIIYGLRVPQIFEINAALLAQKGRILRHNYKVSGCSVQSEAVRQKLIIYGSVISNQKSYWNFGQGSAGFGSVPVSGFSQREITYDSSLYYSPPPYFPSQGEYEFISWEER
ncbi:hypothetical protein HY409_02960 [Candidatus Gottesmanbacteria bacterium]|nr:hypothetical protein [Candidatus Gottesmanbacteria bacterium]